MYAGIWSNGTEVKITELMKSTQLNGSKARIDIMPSVN